MRKFTLTFVVALALIGVGLGCGGSESGASANTGKNPLNTIQDAYQNDPMAAPRK